MSSSTLESGPALVVEEGSQQQQNVQPQRMVDTTSLGSASDGIPFSKSLIEQEEETFYSAKDNQFGDDNLWGLLSGVGGNIYEWYDFAVYGLLASEIGSSFFPKSSKELQLMNSFGVYLAAFLMRPLGAILFGEMGDRQGGRKNALVMSILLITVPSVAMGFLPTYDMWGPIAPILLVLLRMMQGLSVGGQLAGSYVLSIEQSSSNNRGFRGSVCDASSVGGFLLASAVTTIVRHALSEEAVEEWGWRIPFWFSLLLAPCLYYIVNQTEESKFWAERTEQQETELVIREEENVAQNSAVSDLLSSPFRRRQLAGMIGVLSAVASSFYTLFLWVPVYLSTLRGYVSNADADLMNFFVVGTYIFLLMSAGKISDSFPHRMDLIRIGLPGVIVACPVMFGMFESESWIGLLLGQLQYAVCLSMVQGGMAAWEVELWMADPTLSFTGVALGHNLASTIFGGTMPLVATWLFYRAEKFEGDDDFLFTKVLPGLYISFLGCVSFLCISFVIRHPHDVRTGELKIRNAANLELKTEAKKRKKKRKALERRKKEQQFQQGDLWGAKESIVDITPGQPQHSMYVAPMT
uniref:Major facilitator superfamily (MFS) profile domain-containing protein n=2 Tax=Attheya septentrionalis TaxID=420275 RepID=A0A7S2UQH4_9STRA|mmetsp:Transcript_6371/g.11349  ORF Transcript_6371/g.11349 Transcript_6371/m.11349 type:complete len:579 (+) Transcript_6371:95-1831(+)|eukprot:CAMPEP_0198293868 /NCGR_PEP_ID=MMETSP1449-20131203/19270_1 /TAXON_ID=420275 /ORGANISM="Attheya septentrionalis, Strain CCMP2084" /LENGTH=578 /DNA_ID=CAMNT_0043993615 /DNA_START=56 /DNA_END=1792 /DNA_ORIENTATION=+